MLDDITPLLKSRDFVPVITARQARDFDRYTIDTVGIKPELLMESAGSAVARVVMREWRTRKNPSIIAFVGPGNNGADAIVACRYLLAQEIPSRIFFVAEEKRFTVELQYQLSLLKSTITSCSDDEGLWFSHALPTNLNPHHDYLIIDGIFGAGLSRCPRDRPLEAINFINGFRAENAHRSFVVSVDIPSGLSLDACLPDYPHIKADRTVTFGYQKPAHISEPTKIDCGTIHSVNISLFTNDAITIFYRHRRQALVSLFKPLKATSHKGHFGHVLVYEGHQRFLGASRLCARAALRIGAGLVSIATDKTDSPSPFDIPEFMRIQRQDISAEFMKSIDAVVLGPGLSTDTSTQNSALDFIHAFKEFVSVLVLDADGLRLLGHRSLANFQGTIIATPHPKEAGSLLELSSSAIEGDRFSAIEKLGDFSKRHNLKIIWVLKGATTLVRAVTGEVFAFRGDLPILSAGGSGDVLSGAIAGATKQTASPLAATLLAVSVQIASASLLSNRIKKGCFATEIADTFPRVTRHRPVFGRS